MEAEAAVKKLARLPGNAICPNCGTQKKFGFGSVCIKYLTFVCNECKSSHQAISHRCKSLTMSSWTVAEVLQLQQQGGNDRARATWLAHAPPYGQGGRPCAGSDLQVYKAFVVDVYERKKYYSSSGVDADNSTTDTTTTTAAAVPQPPAQYRAAAPRQPVVVATPTPPVVVAPVVDLLDFGAFADAATLAPVSTEGAFDPFQQHQSPGLALAKSPAPLPSSTPMDLFAGSGIATATTTTTTVAPTAADPFGGFDPFAATGSTAAATTTTTTTTKQPIMRNNSGNAAAVMNPTITTGMPNQMMNGVAPMGGMGMSSYNNNNNNNNTNAFLGMQMNTTMSTTSNINSQGNLMMNSNGFGFVPQQQQSQFMPTNHHSTPMMGFNNNNNMGMMNGTMANGFGNFNAGGTGVNNSGVMTMSMPSSGFPHAASFSGSSSNGLNPGFRYGSGSSVPQQQQHPSYTSHNFTGGTSKPDPFAGLGM